MPMNGLDVSSFQANLNIAAVSYDFIAVKATQGTTYVNPYCDVQFQNAKAAGKKLAVYHYADGGDAVAEANWFVDHCSGYIRQAIFVLDWEGEGVEYTTWALQFLQHVELRIGYKPAIYMSEWVANNYNWSAVVANDNGLWAAKYSDYEIDNNYDMSHAGEMPDVNWWPFYFMWQWTSKGHLSGYAGDLDCDIAYLTPEQWDAYAGVLPVAPPPPPIPVPEPVVTIPVTPSPTVPNKPIDSVQPPVQPAQPPTVTTNPPVGDEDPIDVGDMTPGEFSGYARKFMVALIAAIGILGTSLTLGSDGGRTITGNEWVTVGIAFLGSFGVYITKNKEVK